MSIDGTLSTVFFPGAGSFGSEFQLLSGELRPDCRLVRYPGRHGRDFGTSAGSFEDVVRACADQVVARRQERPVLFGHSYGAYVAYATAGALNAAGVEISALVVAGANAPGRFLVPRQAAESPAGAAQYLAGVDPALLEDAPSDEWREIIAETTAQDLRLLQQFGGAGAPALHCPVLAVHGDADPLTSAAAVAEWELSTDGAFAHVTLPGGHSDILRTAACVSWFRDVRDRLTRGTWPSVPAAAD